MLEPAAESPQVASTMAKLKMLPAINGTLNGNGSVNRVWQAPCLRYIIRVALAALSGPLTSETRCSAVKTHRRIYIYLSVDLGGAFIS